MRIHFRAFTLDLDTRQLTQAGRPIHLTPKAFDLLAILAVDRPNVQSKAQLQQCLWPDTFVDEANLSNLVAEVRHALGDRARDPVFIRTSHGFGYAFCGEAVTPAASPTSTPHQPVCWIEWGTRRFPLSPGENIVGRDADIAVSLDASTVSRRHARLIVTGASAILEDFGSKNGTFHGNDRVSSPVQLTDGDPIRIGSLTITFHAPTHPDSTETQVRQS